MISIHPLSGLRLASVGSAIAHTNGPAPILPLMLLMATAGLFISLALTIYLKKIQDAKGKEPVWQALATLFGIIGGIALLGSVIGIFYFSLSSGGQFK